MGLKEVLEAWKETSLEDLLREMYIKRDLSIPDVARELHISCGYVHKNLIKLGIKKHNDLWK